MFISAPPIIRAAVRSATRIQLTSDNKTSGQHWKPEVSAVSNQRVERCITFAPKFRIARHSAIERLTDITAIYQYQPTPTTDSGRPRVELRWSSRSRHGLVPGLGERRGDHLYGYAQYAIVVPCHEF